MFQLSSLPFLGQSGYNYWRNQTGGFIIIIIVVVVVVVFVFIVVVVVVVVVVMPILFISTYSNCLLLQCGCFLLAFFFHYRNFYRFRVIIVFF